MNSLEPGKKLRTKVCVAAPANAKDTKSQLEFSRSSNSEAIVGCVAITKEPSAFAVKVPTSRIDTILITAQVEVFWACSLASSLAVATGATRSTSTLESTTSNDGVRCHGRNWPSKSPLDDEEVKELSPDELDPRRAFDNNGDLSSTTLCVPSPLCNVSTRAMSIDLIVWRRDSQSRKPADGRKGRCHRLFKTLMQLG